MSRDRSLDEFATGGGSDEADSDGIDDEPGEVTSDPDDESPDAPAASAEEVDPGEEEVEPIESTYRWSPEGGVCEACGASVETRWRDDEGLVCADCKAW